MNNKDKDFLGTAPIGKLLLSLALPTDPSPARL